MLSTSFIDEMYQQWLGGLSIRRIGAKYQLGRMSVWGAFQRAYGKDACNLRKQSLARVVYKEYGDVELAKKARGIEGLFHTAITEENYSHYQTTDLTKYHLASLMSLDSQRKGFNLDQYMFLTAYTTHILYVTMWNRINRRFGSKTSD